MHALLNRLSRNSRRSSCLTHKVPKEIIPGLIHTVGISLPSPLKLLLGTHYWSHRRSHQSTWTGGHRSRDGHRLCLLSKNRGVEVLSLRWRSPCPWWIWSTLSKRPPDGKLCRTSAQPYTMPYFIRANNSPGLNLEHQWMYLLNLKQGNKITQLNLRRFHKLDNKSTANLLTITTASLSITFEPIKAKWIINQNI